MDETNKQEFNEESKLQDDFIKSKLNLEALEEIVQEGVVSPDHLSNFCFRIAEIIDPASSPAEMVEKVVRAALEVEFGSDFTSQAGSAKMIKRLADAMIDNKKLKDQALSIAHICLENKIETESRK